MSDSFSVRQGPELLSCEAILKKVAGSTIEKMQVMNCLPEGTVAAGEDGDSTFKNPKDLNMVELKWEARQPRLSDLPPKPSYIFEVNPGVIGISVEAKLTSASE